MDEIAHVLNREIADEHGNGIVTSYIVVVEYMRNDGELICVTMKDDGSPPWRHLGLLSAVTIDMADTGDED